MLHITSRRKAGALFAYLSIGLSFLVSVVYTPIMLRLLGQSEYGLYNLVLSVVDYLSVLNFGLAASYVRFYSRCRADNDEVGLARLNGMFLSVLGLIAAIALVLGIILALNIVDVMNGKLLPEEEGKAKILTLLLAFNLALSFPAGLTNAYATVHECFVFLRIVQILRHVVSPLLVIPVLLMGFASVGLAVVTVGVNCTAELVIACYSLKRLKMRFDFSHFERRLLFEIGLFSFYVGLNAITNQINWNVGKYLVGIFYNTAAVAIYALGSQVGRYYQTFSVAVSAVFIPHVNRIVAASDDNAELTRIFAKIGRVQFYVMAMICLGFIFFGRPFVHFWAGPQYTDAHVIVLLIIIPGTVPLIQNLGVAIQRAKNMHKFRSLLYVGMAMVNLAISIPLCRAYGCIGAAMGTALALVVANGLVMNWYYHARVGLDMFFFWREILRIVPGFIAPAAAGLALNHFTNLYALPEFLLSLALFSAIYCASVYVFSFNDYEKSLVRPVFRKLHLIRD